MNNDRFFPSVSRNANWFLVFLIALWTLGFFQIQWNGPSEIQTISDFLQRFGALIVLLANLVFFLMVVSKKIVVMHSSTLAKMKQDEDDRYRRYETRRDEEVQRKLEALEASKKKVKKEGDMVAQLQAEVANCRKMIDAGLLPKPGGSGLWSKIGPKRVRVGFKVGGVEPQGGKFLIKLGPEYNHPGFLVAGRKAQQLKDNFDPKVDNWVTAEVEPGNLVAKAPVEIRQWLAIPREAVRAVFEGVS